MTTDKPKPPETPGMAEVSAKFEPEAEAAISDLVFNMESPISSAEEAVNAMQVLIEDGIPESSHKAVICLAGEIRYALNGLLQIYKPLFDATRTPAQRRASAAFAAKSAEGIGAPSPAPAADTAWPALWQEWQRGQREEDQAFDAMEALAEGAKEVRRKRADQEGKPPAARAGRAAAELDTPSYRAACAGHDAAKQRYSDCGDALTEVEERIVATPARCTAGALVKLRIGIRETILNYLDSDGRMPEESEIGMYDRMLLAALADLERLTGAAIGPDEVALGQGHATTGHSGMSKGGKGEFLALVEELDDIRDTARNMVPGAAYYVLVERVQELDEKMLETRAGTLAGVVWKLKELTRLLDNADSSVFERRLANSALTDVETLAGEA